MPENPMKDHPCFNDYARHKYGRVHLPVAPRCNIQCNYCVRDFDCVNESRPGVTSSVLTPEQGVAYLDEIIKKTGNIRVVGIAGPGDPFANPEETISTLKMVREKYPEMLLCVATNGLNIYPYIGLLKDIGISHVTITMNAVKPETAAKIYSWYRPGKRVIAGQEGAALMIERQEAALKELKSKNITVKINTVIIPGVNEDEAVLVAKKASELGADILNCIPMYKTKGSRFGEIEPPSAETMGKIRTEAGKYMPQMKHCARCRADAAGLIGVNNSLIEDEAMKKAVNSKEARQCGKIDEIRKPSAERPYAAVASREGIFVNMHLGEAREFMVFAPDGKGGNLLVEKRIAPEAGGGIIRWKKLSETLKDVSVLFVSSCGTSPYYALMARGIQVVQVEGMISDAVNGVFYGKDISKMRVITSSKCGQSCGGKGGGC